MPTSTETGKVCLLRYSVNPSAKESLVYYDLKTINYGLKKCSTLIDQGSSDYRWEDNIVYLQRNGM
jgi:hypothetical protein